MNGTLLISILFHFHQLLRYFLQNFRTSEFSETTPSPCPGVSEIPKPPPLPAYVVWPNSNITDAVWPISARIAREGSRSDQSTQGQEEGRMFNVMKQVFLPDVSCDLAALKSSEPGQIWELPGNDRTVLGPCLNMRVPAGGRRARVPSGSVSHGWIIMSCTQAYSNIQNFWRPSRAKGSAYPDNFYSSSHNCLKKFGLPLTWWYW